MNGALLQLLGSAAAVAIMTGIAAWAKISRPAPPLDETSAHALLADEFPDETIDSLWIAARGSGAIARAGELALVVYRLGDSWVSRSLPWDRAMAAEVSDGLLQLRLDDIAAPRARLAVDDQAVWPPRLREQAA